jgi:hypothetical protein
MTAYKLEIIATDGAIIDYAILTPEKNKTIVRGGQIVNPGTYMMNINQFAHILRLQAKKKYNGKIHETKLSEYKETPKWLKGLYGLFHKDNH